MDVSNGRGHDTEASDSVSDTTRLVDPAEEEKFEASQKSRKLFNLAVLIFVQFVVSADYGVVPSLQRRMQQDLGLTDSWSGFMGTAVFTGCAISSPMVGSYLTDLSKARAVIFASVLLSTAGELLAAFSIGPWTLLAARVVLGFAHAPSYVFFPIWVDNNAPDGEETRWMATLQSIAPFGNVIGYGVTSFCVYGLGYSWRAAMIGLGLFVLCAGMSVFCLSVEEWAGRRIRRFSSKDSILSAGPLGPDGLDEDGSGSPTGGVRPEGCCGQAAQLLSFPDFWLLSLPPCLFYLVGTAAEYWAVRILTCESCWEAGSAMTEQDASRWFLIGCTVGPLVGLVSGGPIFDFFGGYRNERRARLLCMCIGCCACFLAPLMLYPPSPLLLLVAVSTNACIIGLIIPALNGILLTSVPSRLRPLASGVYGTIVNAIGFQAGPVIVGCMADFYGDFMVGWRFAMTPCVFGAPLLLVAAWLLSFMRQRAAAADGVDGDELTAME
jgi:MFS family permease